MAFATEPHNAFLSRLEPFAISIASLIKHDLRARVDLPAMVSPSLQFLDAACQLIKDVPDAKVYDNGSRMLQ